MIEVLKEVIEAIKLIRSDSSSLNNEDQVKLSLIAPILRSLGWNIANPREVQMEYRLQYTESGKVDYALRRQENGELLVFIEAKRLGLADSGESQLFRYAFEHGVDLLILTDGDVWDFYLATGRGLPPDRRFYRVVLSENEEIIEEYAQNFEVYLKRERVCSGEAIEEARKRLRSNTARRDAKESIPQVWRDMLTESHSRLRDMLSQAVENKCGTKPHLEDLDNFLKEQLSLQDFPLITPPTVPGETDEPRQPRNDERTAISRRGAVARRTPRQPGNNRRTRIIGYTYKGETKNFDEGKRVLIAIIKEFDNLPGFMDTFDLKTRGHTSRVVARNPKDLYRQDIPLANLTYRDMENGWYLRAHMGNETIIRSVRTACEVADVKYDRDLKLVIVTN